jgi:hypothetical protein
MTRRSLAACVALAWVSAATHVVAAVEHLEEYVPFAIAFAVLTVLQIGWGARAWARPTSRLLLAGAAGSLAVTAVWALSRTVGLPIGPEAGQAEAVGALDLVATATELALVAVVARAYLAAARTSGSVRGAICVDIAM